jgi:preprotein translocase subunit SecF
MPSKNSDLFKVLSIVLLIILVLYFIQYSTNYNVLKNEGNLNVENLHNNDEEEEEEENNNDAQIAQESITQVSAQQTLQNVQSKNSNNIENYNNNVSSFPSDQLKPEELLPKDNESTLWAKVNPSGKGNLTEKNYLSSGHFVGVNTVGQSLRNANLQLRSEPPNPRSAVSPWLQSTIEPDNNRKHFEIGQC